MGLSEKHWQKAAFRRCGKVQMFGKMMHVELIWVHRLHLIKEERGFCHRVLGGSCSCLEGGSLCLSASFANLMINMLQQTSDFFFFFWKILVHVTGRGDKDTVVVFRKLIKARISCLQQLRHQVSEDAEVRCRYMLVPFLWKVDSTAVDTHTYPWCLNLYEHPKKGKTAVTSLWPTLLSFVFLGM